MQKDGGIIKFSTLQLCQLILTVDIVHGSTVSIIETILTVHNSFPNSWLHQPANNDELILTMCSHGEN